MHPSAREIGKQKVVDWKQRKAASNGRLTQQQIDGDAQAPQSDITRRAVVTHKRYALRKDELIALAIALTVTAIVAAVLWRLS